MKAHATLIRFSLAALLIFAATQAVPLEPPSFQGLESSHRIMHFSLTPGSIWIFVGIAYLVLILLLCRLLGFNNIDEPD